MENFSLVKDFRTHIFGDVFYVHILKHMATDGAESTTRHSVIWLSICVSRDMPKNNIGVEADMYLYCDGQF